MSDYPKGARKKPSTGVMGKHSRSETVGNPYFARPMNGKGVETRMQQSHNHYAKTGARGNRRSDSGFPVSPARTMRSPL